MAHLTSLFFNYTPTARVITHVLFWVAMFAVYLAFYDTYDKDYAWILASKDLIAVTGIFYTTSYIVIPKWLMRNKLFLCLAWLLIIYLWWALLSYIFFLGFDLYVDQMSPSLQQFITLALKMGMFGPIKAESMSTYILDFVYLISLPMGIKLIEAMISERQQRTELEMKNAELALNNVQLELDFLKSQINPHYLFNALNNILILMSKDVDKAIDSQRHLTGILEYLVYDSSRSTVSLEEEFKFLRNYIELERIRLNPNTPVEVSIEADAINYTVVPLIVFPFLENAFKHGPLANGKEASLRIIVHAINGLLSVNISNGFKKKQKPIGYKGGLGIANVRRRLDLNYPNNHTLVIDDRQGRYLVLLTMRLERYDFR
ncbi:sensor histidine kinase [Sphingobacterium deserti]|uniref:Signal transduction histidine kinase, LytS n=1 Tax=Sphingobacterium deserti TaxID=1229276 RepID=A0A0B8T7H8_9SPHI|nr:histidine kinase [Sphingobacterium deserti]KGE14439.1 signal transduction histidine kinase, LytS [Sphingobacterium deserti]